MGNHLIKDPKEFGSEFGRQAALWFVVDTGAITGRSVADRLLEGRWMG
jgi:hypothetical protein